jgi:hypothetical protein
METDLRRRSADARLTSDALRRLADAERYRAREALDAAAETLDRLERLRRQLRETRLEQQPPSDA